MTVTWCRADVPADVTHRLLQLLMATALTAHIHDGSALVEAIHSNMLLPNACSMDDGLAESNRPASLCVLPFSPGTELLRSFLGFQHPCNGVTPAKPSTAWLAFEASLMGAPLQLLVSKCASWQNLCAATEGAPCQISVSC